MAVMLAKTTPTVDLADVRRYPCDSCPARAQHTVTDGTSVLIFCNHHLAVHQPALTAKGWVTV